MLSLTFKKNPIQSEIKAISQILSVDKSSRANTIDTDRIAKGEQKDVAMRGNLQHQTSRLEID